MKSVEDVMFVVAVKNGVMCEAVLFIHRITCELTVSC